MLKLGLNFAPAPSKLPLTDTMAAVESGARKLTPEDADDLRGRVCGILRRAKVPRSNLTKEQRTVLKELRGLEDEHRDTCERGMMEKSAVAEHAWEHHHPIHWEETTILDHGRGQLLVKEALHIQMTPVEERFNRDGGLEVPGCWTAVMRRQGGRSNPH